MNALIASRTLTHTLMLTGLSAFTVVNTFASDTVEQNLLKAIVVKGETSAAVSITQRMQELKVPGVSIAVIQDHEIVWSKGYGIANSATNTPVDDTTLFQAGSISKPVAALAALKLVEQGKLALDADVNAYLKGWQLSGEALSSESPVTLRHLLTHTGGLTVHGFPGYEAGTELPSTVSVLNGEGNTDKVLVNQTPGSKWRYSGGGYTVMQKMVEDVTGQSFAEYTDTHILTPMGMSSSTYQHALSQDLMSRASAAFDQHGEMFEVTFNDYPEKAAAGLWTTPIDIGRYAMHMQAIMQGKDDGVLQKSMVESMFTSHENDWGLGPEMSNSDGGKLFGHGGKNLGFTNDFRAFVNKGDGIVVMANGDNANPLIREIMITLSNHYQMAIAEQRIIDAVALTDDALSTLQGRYKIVTDIGFDGDFIAEISAADASLHVKVPGDDRPSRIVPTDDLSFTSLESGNVFVFEKDESGNVVGMTVSDYYEFIRLE